MTETLREALKDKVRRLAFLTPEDWEERRGGDSIARTINAVFDILDAEPALATPVPLDEPTPGLREALATALSVALHESADPECSGTPPYDVTANQAAGIVKAAMETPLVRAALAASPAPEPTPGLREALDIILRGKDEVPINLLRAARAAAPSVEERDRLIAERDALAEDEQSAVEERDRLRAAAELDTDILRRVLGNLFNDDSEFFTGDWSLDADKIAEEYARLIEYERVAALHPEAGT